MSLSSEQLKVVEDAEGHFLVRACPGSGKTYTIAAKAARDIQQWARKRQGLAVLSFTNIAQEKVVEDIEQIAGVRIEYPHFVGTIDSFVNQYIFFPYIYLLGFNPEEVEMIGEPFQSSEGWYLKRKCALALRYDDLGELFLPSGMVYELTSIKAMGIAQKLSDINNSKFTQSDAVFYALQILELYPEVIDVVSARFPWLYVDEAQDTTPTHWKILQLLAGSVENERFGVIGDPDQSIYAWNGAKPELFINYQIYLMETSGRVFNLLESHRSSQVICDFYAPYSSLPTVPRAVDPCVANLDVQPIITSYVDTKEILNKVKDYVNIAEEGESHVIVCQSHSFIAEILGCEQEASAIKGKIPIAKDDKNVFNLMHAKYDFDRGNYGSALLRAENVAFNLLKSFDREKLLQAKGLSEREWYTLIEEGLERLPYCNISVSEWCSSSTTSLAKDPIFSALKFEPKRKTQGIEYASYEVKGFFTDADAQEAEQLIRTVHAVKGTTYDHILVILGKDQAKRLLKGLRGEVITDTEDRRKLYVAITRARRSITICMPKEEHDQIKGII